METLKCFTVFISLGILSAVNAIVQAAAKAIVVEYFCVNGHLKPVESVCVGCRARILLLKRPIEWDGMWIIEYVSNRS